MILIIRWGGNYDVGLHSFDNTLGSLRAPRERRDGWRVEDRRGGSHRDFQTLPSCSRLRLPWPAAHYVRGKLRRNYWLLGHYFCICWVVMSA